VQAAQLMGEMNLQTPRSPSQQKLELTQQEMFSAEHPLSILHALPLKSLA
jgi:hypothetical protein